MEDKTKTILIIDDEEDFTFFVSKNLERDGAYKVIVSNNGYSGTEIAKKEKPSLILLDLMMPGVNGFDVLARLKDDPETKAIPVIMLTGKDDDESKEIGLKLKNSDYIVKPVEIDELRLRIERVIRNPSSKPIPDINFY